MEFSKAEQSGGWPNPHLSMTGRKDKKRKRKRKIKRLRSREWESYKKNLFCSFLPHTLYSQILATLTIIHFRLNYLCSPAQWASGCYRVPKLPPLSVNYVCPISHETNHPIMIPKIVLKSVLWRGSESARYFCIFQLLCFSLHPNVYLMNLVWLGVLRTKQHHSIELIPQRKFFSTNMDKGKRRNYLFWINVVGQLCLFAKHLTFSRFVCKIR